MKKEITIHEHAPYVRFKDIDLIKLYDHEDVETEFHVSKWLTWAANFFASIGVCVLLLLAIAIVAEIPDKWISWLVLGTLGL